MATVKINAHVLKTYGLQMHGLVDASRKTRRLPSIVTDCCHFYNISYDLSCGCVEAFPHWLTSDELENGIDWHNYREHTEETYLFVCNTHFSLSAQELADEIARAVIKLSKENPQLLQRYAPRIRRDR